LNSVGAEALLPGRGRSIAGVLAAAAALLCLHWLAIGGTGPDAAFTGRLSDVSASDHAAGRIRIALSGAAPASRDPRAIRSLLDISKPMAFGDFVWNEAGVPAGPMWVRVDLRRQVISVLRGGNEIGAAVIIYGAQNKRSPLGQFKVLVKDEDYHSATYDAGMPFAVFLTRDGVAIHASDVRVRNATHGCIGVPIEFAQRLYAALKVGDPVDIVETADRPETELHPEPR
jgi:hypothetical protein